MRDARNVVGQSRQSSDSPQRSPSGLEGDIFRNQSFPPTTSPPDMPPVRKSDSQGDPYAIAYRISSIFEVVPAGGSGAQYVALAGEGNGRFQAPLDFEAHAFLIDNWSAQYVQLPTLGKFLVPWQIGVVVVSPRGATTIDLKFIAPAGKATPGVIAGQFTSVQAYEGALAPSAGVVTT